MFRRSPAPEGDAKKKRREKTTGRAEILMERKPHRIAFSRPAAQTLLSRSGFGGYTETKETLIISTAGCYCFVHGILCVLQYTPPTGSLLNIIFITLL
jgi:hypothetical protein